MNSDVDVNVLITVYNQRIAQLINQNILLEAKLESLTKDFETERENLLMQLMDKKGPPTVVGKSKSDFKESEVD